MADLTRENVEGSGRDGIHQGDYDEMSDFDGGVTPEVDNLDLITSAKTLEEVSEIIPNFGDIFEVMPDEFSTLIFVKNRPIERNGKKNIDVKKMQADQLAAITNRSHLRIERGVNQYRERKDGKSNVLKSYGGPVSDAMISARIDHVYQYYLSRGLALEGAAKRREWFPTRIKADTPKAHQLGMAGLDIMVGENDANNPYKQAIDINSALAVEILGSMSWNEFAGQYRFAERDIIAQVDIALAVMDRRLPVYRISLGNATFTHCRSFFSQCVLFTIIKACGVKSTGCLISPTDKWLRNVFGSEVATALREKLKPKRIQCKAMRDDFINKIKSAPKNKPTAEKIAQKEKEVKDAVVRAIANVDKMSD